MKRLGVLIALGTAVFGSPQAADVNQQAEQAAQERYLQLQERLSDRMESMLAESLRDDLCLQQADLSTMANSPACHQAGHDQLLAAD